MAFSVSLPSSANANTMTIIQNGKNVLNITADGEVVWMGKPSQAADHFVRMLENVIDSRVATASMRQRTYLRACRSILARARSMSTEELIAFLEGSVQNRENHVMLLSLRNDKSQEL